MSGLTRGLHGPFGDRSKGPWITAGYDSDCCRCGEPIWQGDLIRADGRGGWECEDHEEDQ